MFLLSFEGVFEFWVNICPDGIGFNNKDNKYSERNQRRIQIPAKHIR